MKKKDNSSSDKPGKKLYKVSLEPKEVFVTSQDKEFLQKFLDIIEEKLSKKKINLITIDMLCDKLGFSPATLNRKVKELTGESPIQFIQSFCMKRAKQLIEKKVGTVSEVAEMLGYLEYSNFSRAFTNKFGISPKAYEKKCKQKEIEKTRGASTNTTRNQDRQKRMSILLNLTIDDLDRGYISGVMATKDNRMYEFDDREGTPQRRDVIMQSIEMFYDPPISLASDHPLTRFTLKELHREINIKINKLYKKVRDINPLIGYTNERFELHHITDGHLNGNARSVAAVCMQEDLLPTDNGDYELRTKNYGKTFNLRAAELFYRQPTAAGLMYTAVLVSEDVMATSARFVNKKNIERLRFVFGYAVHRSPNVIPPIPTDSIYKAVEILPGHHRSDDDIVLVRLHKKITDRKPVAISGNSPGKGLPIYVMGHPNGLPLKYAPGLSVGDVGDKYFSAALDVYSGNSGSPVFCAKTHELVGIVSRAHTPDFRWDGTHWFTLRYPKSGLYYKGAQIAKSSEFKMV